MKRSVLATAAALAMTLSVAYLASRVLDMSFVPMAAWMCGPPFVLNTARGFDRWKGRAA